MKRVRIIVSGRVQGVFFRHNTNKIANELGLTGFVRNLSGGCVEVVAEGEEDKINRLIEFCKAGPIGAQVSRIHVAYERAKKEFKTFEIR